jgi:D-3-phosphoglycerate dehydrogenase
MMKPTAYLINCARRGIVDEKGAGRGLDAKRIMGAALDVQVDEPPKPNDPLLKCRPPDPHSRHSATSTNRDARALSQTVAQNVLDMIDGRLPQSHVFNPEV